MAAAIVEVEGLTKRFGSRTAVDDVSFNVQEGEVFGFIGPNGAGKTTTIRAMLGLVLPNGGQVRIGGHDVQSDHAAAAKYVGAATEIPGFYPYLTGRRNLRQFGRVIGRITEKDIDEVLGVVEMKERADDKVKGYSMGMRQRLALAQALLGSPKLLVLDEPTNGLDPTGIISLRVLLRRLVDERGMTVFLSSHNLAEAQLLCDRAAVIALGKIRGQGTMEELLTEQVVHYELRVSEPDRAARLLTEQMQLQVVKQEDGTLSVTSKDEQMRNIVHLLVSSGVGVDEAKHAAKTLEDLYVELTQGAGLK
jgi:ABC-2 type transport system ATP-binding protein